MVRNSDSAPPSACLSLVACLPALQFIELVLPWSLYSVDMGSLLEALAWCPSLRELYLWMMEDEVDDTMQPFPKLETTLPFEGLRSLTSLGLSFSSEESVGWDWGANADIVLVDVAEALVSLTSLAELRVMSFQEVEVPRSLGLLEQLRSLELTGFSPCVLKDGCLDLPNLESLVFQSCAFGDVEALPGVTALQSLTRIEFNDGQAPRFFDPQLAQLPRLQHMVFDTADAFHNPGVARLPADMGPLRSTLRRLSFRGHELTHFPLALTQLVALECLSAGSNEFAELPAGITALSRLTELSLGRVGYRTDPPDPHDMRLLDVRALGDLSGFPALRVLSLQSCEVMMCMSILGAVRHPSLKTLRFTTAHPAPECEPVVLQLSQALRCLGRGGVLRVCHWYEVPAQQALLPIRKFMAALEACAR